MVLTAKRLREVLSYDCLTGEFAWIERKRGRKAKIGSRTSTGHIRITVDCEPHLAHRLAWLYAYGHWPENEIDHINRDPADNSLGNLREATHAENGRNRGVASNNKSGYRGVHWCAPNNQWRAQITVSGKKLCLGLFPTVEEAHLAYKRASAELHGAFASPDARTKSLAVRR